MLPSGIPFVPELVVDTRGLVHLFSYPTSVYQEQRGVKATLEHRVLREGGWTAEEPPLKDMPIQSARVTARANGSLQLLWCRSGDRLYDSSGRKLLVQTWKESGWSEPQEVSDNEAAPSCLDPTEMAIVGDGVNHLLWLDWREEHFLQNLLTGEGQALKVWHRVWSDAGWSRARRVQQRGMFDVSPFSAVAGRDGTVHLFWIESRGAIGSPDGYSRVLYSVYAGGKWGKPVQLGDNRNYDGTTGLATYMAACGDPGEELTVAWIWSKALSKTETQHLVEYKTLVRSKWSDSRVASTAASYMTCAASPSGTRALVFQEYPEGGGMLRFYEQLGHSVWVLRLEGENPGKATKVADGTVAGYMDAEMDDAGALHVAYVEINGAGEARLVYRQSVGTAAPAMGRR
jgi:hypothetical protein